MHPNNGYGLRIVLLDDNPYDVELIRLTLQEGMDCNVTVLDSKLALTSYLENIRPDVVISDSNIPGWDGLEALSFVREKSPRVPFVFCSGSILPEVRERALKHGAKAWVSKNDLQRLIGVVQRVCGDKRS